jgi:hypothetical protein
MCHGARRTCMSDTAQFLHNWGIRGQTEESEDFMKFVTAAIILLTMAWSVAHAQPLSLNISASRNPAYEGDTIRFELSSLEDSESSFVYLCAETNLRVNQYARTSFQWIPDYDLVTQTQQSVTLQFQVRNQDGSRQGSATLNVEVRNRNQPPTADDSQVFYASNAREIPNEFLASDPDEGDQITVRLGVHPPYLHAGADNLHWTSGILSPAEWNSLPSEAQFTVRDISGAETRCRVRIERYPGIVTPTVVCQTPIASLEEGETRVLSFAIANGEADYVLGGVSDPPGVRFDPENDVRGRQGLRCTVPPNHLPENVVQMKERFVVTATSNGGPAGTVTLDVLITASGTRLLQIYHDVETEATAMKQRYDVRLKSLSDEIRRKQRKRSTWVWLGIGVDAGVMVSASLPSVAIQSMPKNSAQWWAGSAALLGAAAGVVTFAVTNYDTKAEQLEHDAKLAQYAHLWALWSSYSSRYRYESGQRTPTFISESRDLQNTFLQADPSSPAASTIRP